MLHPHAARRPGHPGAPLLHRLPFLVGHPWDLLKTSAAPGLKRLERKFAGKNKTESSSVDILKNTVE